MKRLFSLILLCAASVSAQATIKGAATVRGGVTITSAASTSPIGQTPVACGTFTSNPGCTATFGSSTPASGHTLVAFEEYASGDTINTPTVSGCTATMTNLYNDATSLTAVYTARVTGAGICAVAATSTDASSANFTMIVDDVTATVSGAVDGGVGVGYNFAALTFCSSCTGPSITTVTNGDIVLAFLIGFAPTLTFNSPFTATDLNTSVNSTNVAAAHDVQGAAGAINASWSNGGASFQVTAIVAIKP